MVWEGSWDGEVVVESDLFVERVGYELQGPLSRLGECKWEGILSEFNSIFEDGLWLLVDCE